jgi:hypothetical protein
MHSHPSQAYSLQREYNKINNPTCVDKSDGLMRIIYPIICLKHSMDITVLIETSFYFSDKFHKTRLSKTFKNVICFDHIYIWLGYAIVGWRVQKHVSTSKNKLEVNILIKALPLAYVTLPYFTVLVSKCKSM